MFITLLDKRFYQGSSNTFKDTASEITAAIQQIVFSPSVRYHLPLEGLHLNAGLNLELMLNNSGDQIFHHFSSKVYNKISFQEPTMGFGIHFGVGYDYFIADYANKGRFLITPFADINFRSSMINDNSSNFYSSILRLGLSIKFGMDEIKYDTLYFDETFEEIPQYLASIRRDDGVYFSSYIPIENRPAGNIDLIASSQLISDANVKNKDSADVFAEVSSKSGNDKPKVEISSKTNPAREKDNIKFSFPTSASTELTKELKAFLDKVADYLIKNPKARVILTGHSDSQGSLEIANNRSKDRAKNAEKYLLNHNVPQGRITAIWRGSVKNIKPNNTEAGRRENRRVEVVIID